MIQCGSISSKDIDSADIDSLEGISSSDEERTLFTGGVGTFLPLNHAVSPL